FARAYNLKTHTATHDAHKLKLHICPHRSCGRSFSREHDLGRHLIGIHRDDGSVSYGLEGFGDDPLVARHFGFKTARDSPLYRVPRTPPMPLA
ncbi:hypothetical protein DFH07DRAFT_738816, partial [Mycena maculata]